MPTNRERAVRAAAHVVVVGASAGGVPALTALVSRLRPDTDAAILVVLHVPPYGLSVLPDILERASGAPAAHPRDHARMLAGNIYVAPPDHHLLVEDGTVRVTQGSSEHGYRPSIDSLFRSAARARGRAVIAVVLSGALDDGAAGLACVHEAGGTCIVQDPEEAVVRSMPEHALRAVPTALTFPLDKMAAWINDLTGPLDGATPVPVPGPTDATPGDGPFTTPG